MTRIPADRGRGFTLIEILVVIVMIGVITTMATLSLTSGGATELQREVERLQGTLQLAADEAVMRATPIGLALERNGYRFLRFESKQAPGKWSAMGNHRALRPHETAEGISMRLASQGQRDSSGSDDTARPDIVIRPSGVFSAFELTVRDERINEQLVITADGGGRLWRERDD